MKTSRSDGTLMATVPAAMLLGVLTATVRENLNDTARWLGAATAGPLLGAIIAGVVKYFWPARNFGQWMFWVSLFVAGMNALPKH